MQEKEEYGRKLFFLGAVWNWCASIFLWCLSVSNVEMLGKFHTIPPTMQWYYCFLGCVFIFGIGYYWVAEDVTQNHGIIKMGVLGKTMVFIIFLTYLLKGAVGIPLFLAGCVDLIFTILFIRFLVCWSLQKTIVV